MREKTLLCFGFGYSAAALSQALPREAWRVVGTKRSPSRHEHVDIVAFNGEASPALQQLVETADAILLSIPPDAQGDCVLRAFSGAFAARQHGWLGYLSTTGVYGDRGGRWVSERSPRAPQSEQSVRRALAEDQALALARPACIFRLPGIYGPGRSALDRVGEAGAVSWIKPGQVFSRIHVWDLAEALRLSIAANRPGAIYNVCDDEPAPQEAVQRYGAMLLGVPAPPELPLDLARLGPMAQRFWAENKRVSNARLKAELNWRPHYPSFRDGLSSIARCDSRKPDHERKP